VSAENGFKINPKFAFSCKKNRQEMRKKSGKIRGGGNPVYNTFNY
jgi:hypothetical protein